MFSLRYQKFKKAIGDLQIIVISLYKMLYRIPIAKIFMTYF